MLLDRAAGERAFDDLLWRHPRSGLAYFMRGGAYESLGDLSRALEDYERAVDLLPPGEWHTAAQAASARLSACRGDTVR